MRLSTDVTAQLAHLHRTEESLVLAHKLQGRLQTDESRLVAIFASELDSAVDSHAPLPLSVYTELGGSRCAYGPMIHQYLPRHRFIFYECMRLSYNVGRPWIQARDSLYMTDLEPLWLGRVWEERVRQWVLASEPALRLASRSALPSSVCAICLESLTHPRTLPCRHSFHARCVESWLRRSSTCPLCRERVGGAPSGSGS